MTRQFALTSKKAAMSEKERVKIFWNVLSNEVNLKILCVCVDNCLMLPRASGHLEVKVSRGGRLRRNDLKRLPRGKSEVCLSRH